MLLIVIAGNIEQICKPDSIGYRRISQRRRYRPAFVDGFDCLNKRSAQTGQIFRRRLVRFVLISHRRMRERIIGKVNLVADAPKNNRRVIAVAANHILNISDSPFLEDLAVPVIPRRPFISASNPFFLRRRKFIKGLIHHQKTHLVAQVQQFRCGRVMAGANGVAADFPQLLKAGPPEFFRHGCPQRSAVVMQTDPLDFQILTIEEKSFVGVKADRADAEGHNGFVKNSFPRRQHSFQTIQKGLLRTPQQGLLKGKVLTLNEPVAGPDVAADFLRRGLTAGRVKNSQSNLHRRRLHRSVKEGAFDGKGGLSAVQWFGLHIDTPGHKVQGAGDNQTDMAIDSRPAVPPRISKIGMVRPHRDNIRAVKPKMLRQLILKADIPERPHPQIVSVYPYFGVFIDTVKLNQNNFPFPRRLDRKGLPVPADAPGKIAGAAGPLFAVRPFNAPVMRQVHRLPSAVIKIRLLGTRDVFFGKFPVKIKIDHRSRLFCPAVRNRNHRQHHQQTGFGSLNPHIEYPFHFKRGFTL